MRNRHFPLFVLVLLFAASIVAQPNQSLAQADQLDQLIKAEMQSQNIPGLSLVVLKDGEIVKAKGYPST